MGPTIIFHGVRGRGTRNPEPSAKVQTGKRKTKQKLLRRKLGRRGSKANIIAGAYLSNLKNDDWTDKEGKQLALV